MNEYVTPMQFQDARGTEDWRVVSDGATAYFKTSTLAEGVRFAQAVCELAGIDEHPPDLDLRADGVTVRLVTSNAQHYGMSRQDIEVARRISDVARKLGLMSDPSAVQSLLIVPGAPDVAAITPFWRAVLGYAPRPDSPDEDLIDTRGRGPAFWFEGMDEPRSDGGGSIHVAVWVPIEEAEARVAAALAAGGRMVRDEFAPAWWTLADAAGNEADISTVMGRG